jgi:hypothetical protein
VTDGAFPLPGRIVEEAGHLFSEIVPPEAQTHLLNAQRELLLAVAITIEHNASRRPTSPRAKPRRRARTKPAERRPSRVELE